MGSALDSASLIMYPSGYSDGVLGSAKPTDGSGDFTFTRGSNLSATRVGPNGYIEKGYENLLTYSNDFSNAAWNKVRTNISGGQAGYDGSNDAWVFQPTSVTPAIIQSISNSGVATFSVYAKANSVNWIRLQVTGSVGPQVFFDLDPNTIGNRIGLEQNNIDASIEDIGSGWFRCSVAFNSTTTSILIFPCIDSGVVGDANSSIYIQDAMLNQGLVAYPYIETTTAPVAGGILEDEPRIDFSDGCGHLLLEPSRTNLIPYSEYANAVAGSLATITDNVTTSPEGVQNAARFLPTSAFGRWESDSFGSGITNGTTYVASMYFNTNSTLDIVTFYIGWNASAGADRIGITFNPSTRAYISTFTYGSATLTDYDIGEADNNGWYRVSLIAPATNANASTCLVLRDLNSQANGSDFVDFYGWQMEQDATYPTSYIPTYGVSQTRLVDSATASNVASLLSKSEGTLYLEVKSFPDSQSLFTISDGGISNRIGFYYQYGVDLRCNIRINNTQTNITGGGNISDAFHKIALTYKAGLLKMFVDGVLINSASYSGSITSTLNTIEFAQGNQQANALGEYKQALVFPTALSDDECIALTTI